jgi:hypothetical protein
MLLYADAFGRPSAVLARDVRERLRFSLNERSIMPAIRAGVAEHLDLAKIASDEFGIKAVDYRLSFFRKHVASEAYLTTMNRRAAQFGVRSVLLIVDCGGDVAASDMAVRKNAMATHLEMIDVGVALGCSGICVEARGDGDPEEISKRLVAALSVLAEVGESRNINIMLSSDSPGRLTPRMLQSTINKVGSARCGLFLTLNDDCDVARQALPDGVFDLARGVCVVSGGGPSEPVQQGANLERSVAAIVASDYRGYVSLEDRGDDLDWGRVRAMVEVVGRLSGV